MMGIRRLGHTRKSAVDITFLSSDISTKGSWHSLDDPMGSDHVPILLKIKDVEVAQVVFPTASGILKKLTGLVSRGFHVSCLKN